MPRLAIAIDSPIDSPPLADLIEPDDSILIVASDATRATGGCASHQSGGAAADSKRRPSERHRHNFRHRNSPPVRDEEKAELLSPFIAQRIRTINHDAYDATNLIQIGTAADRVPIEINRALKDFSKVILTGGVGFHYFAGFTGGRKSICPGWHPLERSKRRICWRWILKTAAGGVASEPASCVAMPSMKNVNE
jgi:nickel-dependent lactate racemase